MDNIEINVNKAFKFLRSDVGSEAIIAFRNLLHDFQDNLASMVNTWPELSVLFEVGFFVRGPSVFADKPDDSDDGKSFLRACMLAEDPKKFALRIMIDTAKQYYGGEEEDDE